MPDAADQHGMLYEGGGLVEDIRSYVLSVAAAAMVLAILGSLLEEKSGLWNMFRLIGGLFLAFTVVQPITRLDLDSILTFSDVYADEAVSAAALGKSISEEEMRRVIKSRTEAYILDKAETYDARLEAEVTLSSGETPVPVSVTLHGAISPYGKSRLQRMLQEELGISKEHQKWIG